MSRSGTSPPPRRSRRGRPAAATTAASPEGVQQSAEALESASRKLRGRPDDKQALDELNGAVERLRKVKAPKPDP